MANGNLSDRPTNPDEEHNATSYNASSNSRSLGDKARELWHQKPGPREPRVRPAPAVPTKEIVNGLDQREVILGITATGLMLLSTVVGYLVERHSATLHTRQVAGDLLVAGLVLAGLLALGTALRRRALLGFAAFMTGFEMITGGNVAGVIYLFFGGWLILRVMRRQKQEQAAGRPTPTLDTGPNRSSRAGQPRPSKRYTPPRTSTRRH